MKMKKMKKKNNNNESSRRAPVFQLRVKKQCCSLLLPVCLVFEIHHDFYQNRINSTEFKFF